MEMVSNACAVQLSGAAQLRTGLVVVGGSVSGGSVREVLLITLPELSVAATMPWPGHQVRSRLTSRPSWPCLVR